MVGARRCNNLGPNRLDQPALPRPISERCALDSNARTGAAARNLAVVASPRSCSRERPVGALPYFSDYDPKRLEFPSAGRPTRKNIWRGSPHRHERPCFAEKSKPGISDRGTIREKDPSGSGHCSRFTSSLNGHYCYPMTGVPGTPLPEGWDSTPGESYAIRHEFAVHGISTRNGGAELPAV